MNARCAALLLAALATSGCTSGAWRDRGHDLAQVFDVTFSVGPGMAANVRVTELAQVGFGDFDGHSSGVIDGRFAGIREQRAELGLSLLHTYEYRRTGSEALLDVRQPHFADPGFEAHPLSWQMETDRNDADVGLGLHVAYVGANAAFHFDEFLDFLAGCVGLDPLRDDAWSRDLDVIRRQANSLDAKARNRAFDALLRRGEPIHGYAIYTAPDVRPSYQRRAMDVVQGEREQATPPEPSSPQR